MHGVKYTGKNRQVETDGSKYAGPKDGFKSMDPNKWIQIDRSK